MPKMPDSTLHTKVRPVNSEIRREALDQAIRLYIQEPGDMLLDLDDTNTVSEAIVRAAATFEEYLVSGYSK